MNGDIIDVSHEQANAIANLPQSMALIKLENDKIMSLAAARPRDWEGIKQDLFDQLNAFPELAEKAIYAKPIGKQKDYCAACGHEFGYRKGNARLPSRCPQCSDGGDVREGQQQYAFGLSIRMAETLAECLGFNRIGCDMELIDRSTVKLTASFTDYQKGRIYSDSAVVSRMASKHGGGTYELSDDRFYGLLVKAEKSKLIREVIIRCMPAGIKAWISAECERIQDTMLDDATVGKIVGKFSTRGITKQHLENHLNKPASFGWTGDDRRILLGLWNSLESGDVSVGEITGEAALPPPVDPKERFKGHSTGSAEPKTDHEPQSIDDLLAACKTLAEVEAVRASAIDAAEGDDLKMTDAAFACDRRADELKPNGKKGQGTLLGGEGNAP